MSGEVIRREILEILPDRPDMPRLWEDKPPVDLGYGWKFKCFQHWDVPLWVELVSPTGVTWESYMSAYGVDRWRCHRVTSFYDPETESDRTCREPVRDPDHTWQEAEAALERLLKVMKGKEVPL